jgi:predicted permease
VQDRLEAMPGVIAVAQTTALPTEDWHARGSFDADWLPRTDHRDAVNAEVRSISGNFLRALGTPLLSGRELTASDAGAKPARVIVNRAFALQYLPDGNIIGRHISNDQGAMEIVGVIADIRGTAGSLADKVGPEVYFPADGAYPPVRRSFIVRSLLPAEQLVPAIREAVHQADSQQAVSNVATMDALLDESIEQPRMNMTLVAAFAGLALLLACVGIYGVVAWAVAQRVREIGVRMALGATRRQISFFFLNQALKAAILGVIAGTVAALLLMRLLRGQLYGVGPENPWAYAMSIAVVLFPVCIATLRPVLYAASINPVDALRAE